MTSFDLPGFPPYAQLTPVMQQYVRCKAEAPDALLFFRMGDFYELFGPDAESAASLLNITLTSRDRSSDTPIMMAGVPHHSATGYLKRLLDLGMRVTVAEQMQDPATTKGMVDRAITRIYTPGTVLEEDLLATAEGNWLALLSVTAESFGLALVEVSTGTLLVATEVRPRDDSDLGGQRQALENLLAHAGRFDARELLIPADYAFPADLKRARPVATYIPHSLGMAWAAKRVAQQLGAPSVTPFDFAREDAALLAIAESLEVVARLAPATLPSLTRFTVLPRDGYLALDPSALKNLEILQNAGTGKTPGTLLGVLDCTRTPLGKRRLREVLTLPLRDRAAIAARQQAVTELVQQSLLRERLRDRLTPIRDLARITGRASAGIMTPRDGLALLDTLLTLPGLRADAVRTSAPVLQAAVLDLCEHESLAALLQHGLDMEAPAAFIAGRVIRTGYAAELDELRGLAAGSKETLARLEATERGSSGLKVKVGHNRVHGYYFEIPKSQKDKAPAHWYPRQSLVNAERYITQELRDLEEKVLGAEERATQLELALFKALVDAVAREADSLRRTADAIGWLDLFTTLAQVAAEKRWVCPETLAEPQIDMIESRHPVLEELLGVQQFIPNDARFDPETSQINILTGPNMAGKSTFMRQVALCCVLHQIGSFVPAKAARLGCFDRILTRVGATDDLARGQSTFMVEMVEAAQILHQATPRSLILLDEIGRGTSTYDGLAIAWALAEYLHNTPGCRALTLFATHYHELTQLAEHYPAVKNWRVTLKEQDGQIVFLRRVTEGRAQKSYGVAVARLAGLPPAVVDRASQILAQLDHQQINPQIGAAPSGDRSKKASWPADETLPLFG